MLYINIRWEVINFYIVYKTLMNMDLKILRKNYKKVYIFCSDPKIAITLMSSYVAFYKLKYLFPNIITIAIQNT